MSDEEYFFPREYKDVLNDELNIEYKEYERFENKWNLEKEDYQIIKKIGQGKFSLVY
jgi:hypothetical protein